MLGHELGLGPAHLHDGKDMSAIAKKRPEIISLHRSETSNRRQVGGFRQPRGHSKSSSHGSLSFLSICSTISHKVFSALDKKEASDFSKYFAPVS